MKELTHIAQTSPNVIEKLTIIKMNTDNDESSVLLGWIFFFPNLFSLLYNDQSQQSQPPLALLLGRQLS